jgi:hypothetical protein
MSDAKTKVTVVVPRREFHPGYWSLGRTRGQGVHFLTGKTQIEVTAKELEELREDEAKGFLTLVLAHEAVPADPKPEPKPDGAKK